MPANDMDAALKRVLESGGGRVSGCDPEQNAAYVEGRLRPAERRRLEAHLADCAGCRGLIAEWLAEAEPAPVPPRPARAWWRWAVPALAGVTVVGSVVPYYGPLRPVPPPPLASLEAPAPAVSLRSSAAPAPPPSAEPVAVKTKPTARRIQAADALREERGLVETAAPQPPAAPQLPQVSQSAQSSRFAQETQQLAAQNAAKEVAAAPGAATGVAGGAAAVAAGERRDAELKKVPASPLALRLRQAEADAAPLLDGTALRSQVRRGARVWAVSEGGRLYRSDNGGAAWQPVATPAQVPLVRVEWDGDTPAVIVTDKDNRTYRVQP